MNRTRCRFCGTETLHSFANLGMTPLANSYIHKDNLWKKEDFYPLHAYVCDECFLVQLEEFESPKKIFEDYAYFSSFSKSWLDHVEKYTNKMISRFNLNEESQVMEIASNDGYLLQFFKKRDIPILGIEPAKNVADVAIEKGIPTIKSFFGEALASDLIKKNIKADILIGNNVLAHVPDLNDFVEGMKLTLKPNGVITMEFPHLLRLMHQNQFDTIYHEHFSYFSFFTVNLVFEKHELTIFDVEEISTHGGSLRIYVKHKNDKSKDVNSKVYELLEKEKRLGLNSLEPYFNFSNNVKKTKRNILKFLVNIKDKSKTVVGYGAPAKGNTLLNYCGIGTDFLDYTVDKNTYKQNLFLPGTHIPVYSVEKIKETQPDYIIILPWNLKDEIANQLSYVKSWGGKFVTLIPNIEVF